MSTIDIYLWQPDLNGCHFQQSPHFIHYFSTSEQQRLSSITARRRREEYIAGHYLLRQILIRHNYFASNVIHPAGQPPFIELSNKKLFFNLSHSGNTIVCCFSESIQAGIDIEYEKARPNFLAIAEHYFSSDEYYALLQLEPEQQLAEFYCFWVLKESYLKFQRNDNHKLFLQQQFSQESTIATSPCCLYSEALPRLHLAVCADNQPEAIQYFQYTDKNHFAPMKINARCYYPA